MVQIAFGSQAVESKVAMMPRELGGEAIPAEALAMARMLGGALFFQAISRFIPRDESRERIPLRAHGKIAALAVLGISLNQALFLMGLRMTTPFAVTLLGASIPVATAVIAVIAGQDRFRARTALGLAFAIAGVLTLTGIGAIDRGAALVACNSVAYSLYIVLSRDLVRRYGALPLVTWLFFWGAVTFAPFGARALFATAPHMTNRGWLYLAYIVAMPTIIAYSFNAWALGKSTPTLVTIYIYLQPVVTAVIAWAQLGHRITQKTLLAGALILTGVGIVALRKRAIPPRENPPPKSSAAA